MDRGGIVRGSLAVTAALATIASVVLVLIFVVRVPQRVAHWWSCNSGGPGAPSWSPDGRWIAFATVGSCDTEIAAVHPNGSGLHLVTTAFSFWPAWSPNGAWAPGGRWIAYSIASGTSHDGLYLVRPDGRDDHRIAPFTIGVARLLRRFAQN